jgi:hypothetical protein
VNVSGAGKPPVWLPDTASLLSMAVDDDLAAVIEGELAPHACALFDVVDDELADLADLPYGDPRRALARRAQARLGWLGEVVDTSTLSDPKRARKIQNLIRGARPLRHDFEHWAESVIIDIAEHLTMTKPVLLTEDYNARVEATQRGIEALSVHKLLSLMVRGGRLPAADAEIFAECLRKAGRAGHGYTAVEFASGDLGRVGRP